jgi:hypothetical protein
MGAAALVAALVAITVGVGAGEDDGPRVRSATADVDLPDVVPGGRGLTGDAAAQALAPFTDASARCRPAGCERWWTPGSVEPVTPARTGGDLVVALRDAVAALDPETGEYRWLTPISSFQPDAATGWRLRSSELVLETLDPDGDEGVLVWSPRGYLQLLGPDGERRWSRTLSATRRVWDVAIGDDVVLVASAEDRSSGPVELVTAVDRRHGEVRWRQRVRWTYGVEPDGALVRATDDRVTSLDPATGRAAFHLDVEDPRWVRSAGAFHLARVEGRDTVLIERQAGARLRTVPDVAGIVDLRQPDGAIALLVAGSVDGDGALRPTRVEVVEAGGGVRWERSLGCCVTLLRSPPGTVAVRTVGDGAPLVLDLADGRELPVPPVEITDDARWLRRDLVLVPDTDETALVGPDGARLVIAGARPRVLSVDPLVLGTPQGLLGLELPEAPRVRRPMRGYAAPPLLFTN